MARFPLASSLTALALCATPCFAQAPAFDPITFELVKDSGIDFVTNSGRTAHRHQPETMVSGVAFFDFDNDGLLDVFLDERREDDGPRQDGPGFWNRLYRNRGGFKFEDVTEKAGVKGHGYDNGVATGDYDNDGFDRPLRGRAARERPLPQQGRRYVRGHTAKAGLTNPTPTTARCGRSRRPSSTTTGTATSTSSSPTTRLGPEDRAPVRPEGA